MASSKPLQKLKRATKTIKDRFHLKHGQASEWLQNKAIDVHQLRSNSQQTLAAISMAGAVALGNTSVDAQVQEKLLAMADDAQQEGILSVTQDEYDSIMSKLQASVQMPAGHLPAEDELYIEQQLSDLLGFEVTAELEGHRLNHSIGIMGGEQHLYRYPGDSLAQHDAYQEAGIAPNRGAFGWFTEQGELTETSIQREKYYFAVQTLYLPDWNSNYKELKPWYKFRKMIVINPADQVAVVGVVGDAGPAQWVKKQYGGSPEIIREGKIWSQQARGRVMLLFVDDPEDKIPLGVIDLQQLRPVALADAQMGQTAQPGPLPDALATQQVSEQEAL